MKPKPLPLEPGDFYFNAQGRMVFTAQYHLRRGYCCGSGCKHCPYNYRENGETKAQNASKNDGTTG
ncbi:DUF5522 domain-containing protein [Rufibacter sp. XAAS-G3-1]|uniref:DUF5522 domain-containing protein n=1 Tax=Rufibacter sp. XAAS-G3-1 TaxID=2729134 RepID=UPI0015E62CD1|nr:DUF5522 domain-containing protein [Rufibacter sp. XAAS-G3-1]